MKEKNSPIVCVRARFWRKPHSLGAPEETLGDGERG